MDVVEIELLLIRFEFNLSIDNYNNFHNLFIMKLLQMFSSSLEVLAVSSRTPEIMMSTVTMSVSKITPTQVTDTPKEFPVQSQDFLFLRTVDFPI